MNAEERRRAEALPPLGQHARSVVTEAMPMRFVDEVGAQIASVLAIATAKALVNNAREAFFFAAFSSCFV